MSIPSNITLDHIKSIVEYFGDNPHTRMGLLYDIDSGTFTQIIEFLNSHNEHISGPTYKTAAQYLYNQGLLRV